MNDILPVAITFNWAFCLAYNIWQLVYMIEWFLFSCYKVIYKFERVNSFAVDFSAFIHPRELYGSLWEDLYWSDHLLVTVIIPCGKKETVTLSLVNNHNIFIIFGWGYSLWIFWPIVLTKRKFLLTVNSCIFDFILSQVEDTSLPV